MAPGRIQDLDGLGRPPLGYPQLGQQRVYRLNELAILGFFPKAEGDVEMRLALIQITLPQRESRRFVQCRLNPAGDVDRSRELQTALDLNAGALPISVDGQDGGEVSIKERDRVGIA